jgi:hypothetical protein
MWSLYLLDHNKHLKDVRHVKIDYERQTMEIQYGPANDVHVAPAPCPVIFTERPRVVKSPREVVYYA